MIAPDAIRGLGAGRAVTSVWLAAALVAGSLHLGAAGVAAWTLSADETFDDEGAPAIELAMDMAAPKTEQTDLPPGPEADASAAAPESAQSAAKPEATDRPKEEVVEAENPDRIVAVEEPKKPEEKAEQQQRRSDASTASIASEATAASSSACRFQLSMPRSADGATSAVANPRMASTTIISSRVKPRGRIPSRQFAVALPGT